MREDLIAIFQAIEGNRLPVNFDELCSKIWDGKNHRFHVQETHILDYKETIPEKFSDSYGSGIVRLAIAFHNTYGGLILFGVKDRILRISGIEKPFDVESFNRVLSDFTDSHIECISKVYTVYVDSSPVTIAAVLVPRRGAEAPVRLMSPLSSYPAGKLWVRDRHEVVDASTRHLPLLFSRRLTPFGYGDRETPYPVHRSFPPSPATVKQFVNRGDLLSRLWTWFVLGDQPRLYIHGPGGSGKSTLAFEFAHSLAEHGHSIATIKGDRVDYVIYISGKETEFNPSTGREQQFLLRQFGSAREQLWQILFHSGILEDLIDTPNNAMPPMALIDELFNNYSGLIVIDDIDALSRRQQDTAEELLFMKAVLASRRTRILYTLRFPPTHALNSAIPVPGLDSSSEFFEFVEICCKQFDVPPPAAETMLLIQDATNCLPLLIETIIGLRRYTSNYAEAIYQFNEKGGDDARRYLYSREYDRLDATGRSRQLLAGLYLIEEPVSFATLSALFQFSSEHIREALSECGSVFLSTFDNEGGDTLYQLTPPSVPFIKNVSRGLSYYEALAARISHFRSEGRKITPEDAAMISKMRSLIRDRRFAEIVALADGIDSDSVTLINPSVQSLVGQACAELGPHYRERARECFRQAEGLGYKDAFMMRRWYNLEFQSGYGEAEAERICRSVIDDQKMSPRHKCEFYSKLGFLFLHKADYLTGINIDKAIGLYRQSISFYVEGMWAVRSVNTFDISNNLDWLDRSMGRFLDKIGSNVDQVFALLEDIFESGHDIHQDAANFLVDRLANSKVPVDDRMRARIRGLCSRSKSKIPKELRSATTAPGIAIIVSMLDSLQLSMSSKE